MASAASVSGKRPKRSCENCFCGSLAHAKMCNLKSQLVYLGGTWVAGWFSMCFPQLVFGGVFFSFCSRCLVSVVYRDRVLMKFACLFDLGRISVSVTQAALPFPVLVYKY